MLKADELRSPRSCINKAAPDEPVFVLRANDPLAAQTVRLWATMAHGVHEDEKRDEAMHLANMMDDWQSRLPKAAPLPMTDVGYIEPGAVIPRTLHRR